MNKETYKALKEIIVFAKGKSKELKQNSIKQVETWIDEVAKEYEEEQDGKWWKCPEGCNTGVLWSYSDLAERGEPVCPQCDSDMKLETKQYNEKTKTRFTESAGR